MKTLGFVLVILMLLTVGVVAADEKKTPASACESVLAIARSYNDVVKARADHYEVSIAELRAKNAALDAEAKRLTAELAKAKPADKPPGK